MIRQFIKRTMSTQQVDNFSIHGNSIKEVYDIPMSVVNRPIPSQLDREKVENMKEVLQIPEREKELTPIDVHHVKHNDQDYYFAFGGCHRWAASKELGRETIRAKLIETPASVISTYLGSSSPFKK
ncbi:ParB/Sulfiredoxin [Gilbertella persicaria]|uniref:ParB/Sulfiredoxin n=1 Tax=Gilbertella persicaria TaxID=101096 RepID=UPI00221F7A5F|nr:ParB/Sulfiredoxin [Gilbertella persicaria]KAI8084385.1 ParB/Sulfiredoxin [Gilbertella persicaria]